MMLSVNISGSVVQGSHTQVHTQKSLPVTVSFG